MGTKEIVDTNDVYARIILRAVLTALGKFEKPIDNEYQESVYLSKVIQAIEVAKSVEKEVVNKHKNADPTLLYYLNLDLMHIVATAVWLWFEYGTLGVSDTEINNTSPYSVMGLGLQTYAQAAMAMAHFSEFKASLECFCVDTSDINILAALIRANNLIEDE